MITATPIATMTTAEWLSHITTDPRPDIADDSALWVRLLPVAYGLDGARAGGAFGVLHGLRCMGARLAVIGGQARLFRGDIPEGEYEQYKREYLAPNHETVQRLLTLETWACAR